MKKKRSRKPTVIYIRKLEYLCEKEQACKHPKQEEVPTDCNNEQNSLNKSAASMESSHPLSPLLQYDDRVLAPRSFAIHEQIQYQSLRRHYNTGLVIS